ncbi:hypothetical protein SLEP1_g48320 [Rubroshorea leprosula]|uniref:DUF4283 domain-containing protein n=1 Tax=Rubroshorea leprosula TaxID=152421 RepID=A0AAV5LTH3_9ROSI|nr:hypothetical protein SLEP1_g48320 [Rubroshorea leprosula]
MFTETSIHSSINYSTKENVLIISLILEDKECLYWPHHLNVTVKLFRPSMEFGYVVQKLEQAWSFANDFDVIDLDKGFLLIKLSSEEDFSTILKQGPWFIGDQFLFI